WGGAGYSALLKEAIQRARDAGILFVASAGNAGENNDSYATYPANYNSELDNVVSVAASTRFDDLAWFSDYGATSVDVAAPGLDILSTVPTFVDASGYAVFSGTSMACPHVSGVAALIKARYPTLTFMGIKARLLANVDTPAGLAGL